MIYDEKVAAEHIKLCNISASKSPENLFRVIFLAISSIRISSNRFWINILPNAYNYYKEFGMEQASELLQNSLSMNMKSNGIQFSDYNKIKIYENYLNMSAMDFYYYLVDAVPGLGPTKAAFVVQMAYGELGCIDSVNINRLNIKNRILSSPKKYIDLFYEIGETPEQMWAEWCRTVAERDGMNAEQLSMAHARFIEFGNYNPANLISS